MAVKTVGGTLATSTRPLSIGGNGIWGEYFAGVIDELRLYDHALTAAEIQADMNRAVGGGAPTDSTPPGAPGQPSATVAGSDVSLAWGAASDAGGIARYHVHRSTTSGFTPSAANEIGTAAAAAYTDAAVAPGTYYYVVRAEDNAGNVGAPSPQTQVTVVAPPPPPPPPPTGGLVAAYSFDENGGTSAADSSGNGNKGALENATWAAGKFGSALSFNGSSSRVTIPDSASLDLTKALTLEAWVKPTSAAGWGSVVFKERTSGMLYSLYASNAGNRPVGQVFLGSERSAQGASAVPLNTWTHLATTWDGSTLRLYVNGVQTGSTAVAGTLGTSTGPLRIGGNGIWKEFFKGLIDDVRVYDHALSATAITSDMQHPVTAATSQSQTTVSADLVAAYNFDEPSGETVRDASGLGNDGVASGGPARAAGHTSGGLSFDGGDDMVTVPSSASLSPTSAITVEAWVRPSQLGGTWRTIALKERAGGMCWALYAHDASGAAAHVFTSAELRARGDALTTGTWTHLAMTYDGAVLALYRDGALVASSFVSGPIATSSGALRIGGNTIWQEPFAGTLDDLRIYDRALSAGEIADDMQRPV